MAEPLFIERVHHPLLVELKSRFSGITELFPFDRYESTLNARHKFVSYGTIDRHVTRLCENIVQKYSPEALELYHRILLLRLLMNNYQNMMSAWNTDAVQRQFTHECQRIVQDVMSNPYGFYDYSNDLFCKDLGIATLRMFPAGVLKTEYMAGIPRRILFGNSGSDLFSWIRLIQKTGGFRPYFEIHLDVRYRDGFTPQGWFDALRCVGEMLVRHSDIKGITGASWFFDPQISSISPRLAYLRQSIEENGAQFLFYNRNERTTELAVSSSPTRRKLYEAGRYHPKSYFMVWPRADILRWIEQSPACTEN